MAIKIDAKNSNEKKSAVAENMSIFHNYVNLLDWLG